MERALNMRSKVAGIQALDAICNQLVSDALEAQTARERLAAAAEIFDRVDGKAAQAIDANISGSLGLIDLLRKGSGGESNETEDKTD